MILKRVKQNSWCLLSSLKPLYFLRNGRYFWTMGAHSQRAGEWVRSTLESLRSLIRGINEGRRGNSRFLLCVYLLMVIRLLSANQRAKPEGVMIKRRLFPFRALILLNILFLLLTVKNLFILNVLFNTMFM